MTFMAITKGMSSKDKFGSSSVVSGESLERSILSPNFLKSKASKAQPSLVAETI